MNSTCLSGAVAADLADSFLCNPGFFCPNNTDESPPQFCAPTPACQITRLQAVKNICADPQGTFEPLVCPAGSFCTDNGRSMLKCPEGHFCPLGTAEPFKCRRTSICTAGSEREMVIDGFIVVLAVDLLLIIFMFKWSQQLVGFLRHKLRRSRAKAHPEVEQAGSVDDGFESVPTMLDDQDDVDKDSLRQFIASVKRCVGTSEVGMSFGFQDLCLTLKSGKTILAPQVGHIERGSLWGVMGASGAGKTSFVNVLMGKAKQTSGDIYINRTPSNISRFKKLIGYVPQDDVVTPELTVRENIQHAARIRLPSNWTDAECQVHVDTLLTCLGLAHVQHNIVGDEISSAVSGGQRKRVSIGIELAAAPMALFLDEPTSGLDATSALSIMRLLKMLSHLGVTVVCIIHQPRHEILNFFDGIHLLGAGRQIYHGPARDMGSYFDELGFDVSSRANLADAVLDILSGHSAAYSKDGSRRDVQNLAESWESRNPPSLPLNESDNPGRSQADLAALSESASSRGASWFKQAMLCLSRSMKQQWVQKNSFLLEISVGAIAGLLMGLSLYQLKGRHFQGIYRPPFELLSSATSYTLVPQIALLVCLSIGLSAAAPGVKTFGEEKQIYWREASAGHSRSAYYVGKVLSTFPRLTVSSIHFTTFYCVLAAPLMPFWDMYLVNLMYFYCIYGLASAMSMIVRRENGPLMAMIVSLIIGVFGGYGPPLYNVKEWHLEWFWRVCPGIWLTEAYYDRHLERLGHLYDLDAAAQWTGYARGRFAMDVGLLLVIGTVYRVAAYAGLILLNRSKQR